LGASGGITVANGAAGSISGNTVMNSGVGIGAEGDSISVTSNKIMFSGTGIYINSAATPVQGNTITTAPVGIEFNCSSNPNVHSNTITDAATGVDKVPTGVNTPNTYVNVATFKTGC
jgi:putative cofactor-binding repeat protein